MDSDQIKFYIEQNIKLKEPGLDNPRLALELEHFTLSMCQQEKRILEPTQIIQSWAHWKEERIHYVENTKEFTKQNISKLKTTAIQYVKDHETDPQWLAEAKPFGEYFARALQFLALDPLSEHVAIAWGAWKSGKKW